MCTGWSVCIFARSPPIIAVDVDDTHGKVPCVHLSVLLAEGKEHSSYAIPACRCHRDFINCDATLIC